mmetsp:Transcript_59/g.66  ORF Transcript_59/g.66 Transcript_59/m.66 type:complete len:177 (+) Transcript_59:79-609(+)|eukprot:CAMPEP_0168508980 /NCGR_PEP_ID=MMETSP0405-20121227/469_1 /TAXON_ID=498012 /ORGANISM="Trichosphaerium sp, Strain Am-I-7 wt" /LENGTH=176 /DNA_ID=CAMNT_0008526283 /DNA_START=55 /DNA_END=585 /DNA_ORIENTATION=+
MSKRAGDELEGEAKKKQKTKPAYTFNFNDAVMKEHETKSFTEIIQLPPSALQGLADHVNPMLEAFKITTIEKLAAWKYYHMARAIATLAAIEETGKRDAAGESNLNKALDKEWETKSLKEVLAAPPSVLQGLADWTDSVLTDLKITTVEKLANWKYCQWAEALVTLAKYEAADHSS